MAGERFWSSADGVDTGMVSIISARSDILLVFEMFLNPMCS
jgi:hypothetical protein